MASTTDLEELAETCLATAKTIKTFLASNGHAHMSFDEDGPSAFPNAPLEIQQARGTLRMAAKALFDLVTGPDDFFKWTLVENVRLHAHQSLTR